MAMEDEGDFRPKRNWRSKKKKQREHDRFDHRRKVARKRAIKEDDVMDDEELWREYWEENYE